MKHCIRGLWLAVLSIPLLASAAELPSRRYQLPIDPAARALQLPPLNAEKALAEDALADKGRPLRYALMHKAGVDLRDERKSAPGRWSEVDAAHDLWRTRIDAPGAVSIDLALAPFHLPAGAEVWLSDASGKFLRGPYTAADNPKFGEFWTPYVPGDVAYLEVLVPKTARGELRLGIQSVQQAYRSIESGDSPFAKSGSCNVDVVCSEGNNYRDQINAVARYSYETGWTLLHRPVDEQHRAEQTRAVQHREPLPGFAGRSQHGRGLLEVRKSDLPHARVSTRAAPRFQHQRQFHRADRRRHAARDLSAGRYHPAGAEYRSAGCRQPVLAGVGSQPGHSRLGGRNPPSRRVTKSASASRTIRWLVQRRGASSGCPVTRHWHITDWDLGTTEQGSSGSVLLNPQKRLIGVLSGGGASCGYNFDDYYGRLNVAWEGGGSAASRVRDYLDPGSTGASAIDGRGTCTPPTLWSAANPGTTDAAIEVYHARLRRHRALHADLGGGW